MPSTHGSAPHACWWMDATHGYTPAPEPEPPPRDTPDTAIASGDAAHPDIARVQRMVAELRATQLVAALRNAAEARVGWRQQARDLLHLIDHGILPPVTDSKHKVTNHDAQ